MKLQSKNQALVWGSLLIIFGVVGLVESFTDLSTWAWVAILAATGLGIFGIYLRDRSEWWPLIPAYVLLSIAVMIPLEELGLLSEFLVPAYVMFVIAIPFFIVYFRNPKQWWPLIPGGIMAAIGLSFLLAEAFQYVFPALVILVGIWVLLRSFTRKEPIGDEPSLPAELVENDLQSDE